MDSLIFDALHKQFLFFSDNGAAEIEHPAIAISEASKCCGRPRQEVVEVFWAFEKHGIIARVDQDTFRFVLTERGLNKTEVDELLQRLTM